MSYKLFILRRAQKALSKIQRQERDRIQNEIYSLAGEVRPSGCRKLSGRDGWRIRIGQYRVIYEIDEEKEEVTILDIGHRRDIYRS